MEPAAAAATVDEKSKYDIYFADGAIERGFGLVVGADGAWSRVRPLLSDAKPFYSGVTGVELWATDVNETNPWLSRFVGNGSTVLIDKGRALLWQSNGSVGLKDSVRCLACVLWY